MIRLLILELLSQSPMSGYEMKQILEQTDAKRWGSVLPGSIYNAIKKLESGGFIRIAKIEMTGKRQRSEYEITDNGKILLSELVIEALSSPMQFNGDLYSGIGFAYQINKELAISVLKQNIANLTKEEQEVRRGIKMKADKIGAEISPLSSLVVDHMLKSILIQKELLENTIKTIENESD